MVTDEESQYLLANAGKSELSANKVENDTPVNKGKGTSIWRDLNRRQTITLVYAAACTAAIYLCYGTPPVFLSRVVVEKGGDKLFASAILLSTYLVASISSLICGKYQSKIPTKTFIWSGLLILAVAQGCFGALQYVDNIYVFVVVGVVLKASQGIGQGFVSVAILTLLWHEIPEHVEKSFGLTRAMTGIGFLLSSFTSGYLYSIQNGMMIPCVVTAMVPLIVSFLGWLILHELEKEEQKDIDYQAWRYICKPKAVFVLGLALCSGGTIAVFSGSFTSYAQSVGVSVVNVGLVYAAGDAVLIFASLIAGYFANSNHTCRRVTLAVEFLAMLAVNLSLTSNETLAMLYVQIIIFIVCASGIRTLAFPEMIFQSVGGDEELQNNFTFRSQLSGVWYFATTVSSFVFGVGGTALQNVVSYAISQTICACVGICLTLIASFSVFLCGPNRKLSS